MDLYIIYLVYSHLIQVLQFMWLHDYCGHCSHPGGRGNILCSRVLLALMLLVANLANTKRCKKPEKLLKPWQMGTHLRVGESFQMNTKTTGFQCFFKNLAFLCLDESSLSIGRVSLVTRWNIYILLNLGKKLNIFMLIAAKLHWFRTMEKVTYDYFLLAYSNTVTETADWYGWWCLALLYSAKEFVKYCNFWINLRRGIC